MNRHQLEHLVQPDRVHAHVYTDAAIFELEMERIFRRTWLFACHESQIAHPGDFVTMTLAKQPIIVSRTEEGDIAALFNRCSHRGSLVCREHSGNSRVFQCPFHGWAFRCDGELAGIPFKGAYSEAFLQGAELGLAHVPRLGRYRGFVFVSLAASGVPFDVFILQLKRGIDNLLDRAPGGEVVADSGVHRYEYKGNWKLQIENGIDEYHPPFSHASTVGKDGQQMKRAFGTTGYKYSNKKDEKPDQTARSYFDNAAVHGFPYGQSFLTISDRGRVAELQVPEYRRLLEERHGAAKLADIERETFISNCVFYPNFILRVTGNIHLRVVRPIAVDHTEVLVWPLRMKGAPDTMNSEIMRYANVHASVSSFVQTDDLEVFERCQEGMQAQAPEWIWLARGLNQEIAGNLPDELVAHGTWETGMRTQFRYWKELMSAPSSDARIPTIASGAASQWT
jgi:benzoate/toluate 1,2-dioxygenase alpha subunit